VQHTVFNLHGRNMTDGVMKKLPQSIIITITLLTPTIKHVALCSIVQLNFTALWLQQLRLLHHIQCCARGWKGLKTREITQGLSLEIPPLLHPPQKIAAAVFKIVDT